MTLVQAQLAGKGYTKHVFVERATSGAAIEIVDYEFDGSELEGCEDRSMLRWRLAPDYFSSSWRLRGRSDFVKLGKLMFLPGRVPFQARPSNALRSSRNLVCHFRPELENQILGDLGDWSDNQLAECQDIRCGRIELTLRRLWQEMMHPGFANELLLEGLLATLAVDMSRYFRRTGPVVDDDFPKRTSTLTKADLQRITDFIHGARGGCPTSGQLADLCSMNLSSFRNRFKLTTGRSVHSYVEEVQLERAKDLLINSGMLMKEIAYELGFTHQATFTSSFRRLTGMSPSEYRTAHLN